MEVGFVKVTQCLNRNWNDAKNVLICGTKHYSMTFYRCAYMAFEC